MVEKAGHNKSLTGMRVEWINEGKPKSTVVADGVDAQATEQDQQSGDAATKQAERIAPIFDTAASDRPNTSELDDLFGDAEGEAEVRPNPKYQSIFGDRLLEEEGEYDGDELDALTEAAMRDPTSRQTPTKPGGDTKDDDDEDDLDALMAEAEAHAEPVKGLGANTATGKENAPEFNDEEEAMAEMDGLW